MYRRLSHPLSRSAQFTQVPKLLIALTCLSVFAACSLGSVARAEAPALTEARPGPLDSESPASSPEIEELTELPEKGARRIILVIGDGMGAAQLEAASLYHTGEEKGLVLQSLPVRAKVATGSASHKITDSAAAGTALATAVKVQNGVVGLRFPGDGSDLPSITGDLKEKGWAVGLVTTAFTTHATPAAFGAHVASRLDYAGIARDYLSGLRPEVILGGGGYGMDPETVAQAGYAVVRDSDALVKESGRLPPEGKIAGLFGEGHLPYIYDGRPGDVPSLVEMAEAAVDFLARDEQGFFLMIEGARIDHAGHANDIHRLIPEVLELDAVVEMLLEHPHLQEETLLVVTADHETGGLAVTGATGQGVIPEVTWSTNGHTAAEVPLFATGAGADALAEVVDNTLLRGAMVASLEPPAGGGRLADAVAPTPGSSGERAPSPP
ncbi:MAG: alkaline phosphatase [Alkalispirochaetaceae bacterium]